MDSKKREREKKKKKKKKDDLNVQISTNFWIVLMSRFFFSTEKGIRGDNKKKERNTHAQQTKEQKGNTRLCNRLRERRRRRRRRRIRIE